jgi:hypothetical protein
MTSQATKIVVEPGSGPGRERATPAHEMIRLERCITNAEQHLEEQEARIREAARTGRNTAVDDFNLKKMRLLLAILREGRERVAQSLRRPVGSLPAGSAEVPRGRG